MTIIVFCGPTISPDEVRRELDAVCLPPASQGDIYRASLHRPAMIGIVDGYFHQVPAVWHKEILWAMTQGIAVFGSGSMGALRAAELAAFGMYGVGRVFQDYVSGRLEDDDEVAITHGPADFGYRAFSEAMVNIRYTLQKAFAAGMISESTYVALLRIAKSAPYRLRTYQLLHDEGGLMGLPQDELGALRAWLPQGRVDQKRDDARQMLFAIKERLEQRKVSSDIEFTFNHTIAWENFIRTQEVYGESDVILPEFLIEELLLNVGELNSTVAGATLRCLALREARQRGYEVGDETLKKEEDDFRRAHELADDNAFEAWLEANYLSVEQFRAFVIDNYLLKQVQARLRPVVLYHLADHLRTNGKFAQFARRASHKQNALKAQGLQEPQLDDVDLSLELLVQWYLDRTPKNKEAYAYLLRFAQEDSTGFIRAALREYLYTYQLEGQHRLTH
jgi:hypothetical protein